MNYKKLSSLAVSKLAAIVIMVLMFTMMWGCSGDEAEITEPPVAEDPWEISLARTDWSWASSPLLGEDYVSQHNDVRTFDPEDRVEAVRWFLPKDRTLRRYLDPDLSTQAGNETQPCLNLYLRSDEGPWGPESWGGIMQGLSRVGEDVSEAQFVQFWVNDGRPDPSLRSGKFHIDFGFINEDGFWPMEDTGQLVVGEWEREDGVLPGTDPDGVWTYEEDIGLAGEEFGDQRYSAEYEMDVPGYGVDSPFPRINGTARNGREDDEDINGDVAFNMVNGYFTLTIDLKDTPAVVDVVADYEDVQDLVDEGLAWRKYRLPIAAVDSVGVGVAANLSAVTHVRIWYEDPDPGGAAAERSFQFSEFKFVGDSE